MSNATHLPFFRPNVFDINLKAVAQCAQQIRELVGPEIFFIATLKANAYGYGVLPVARTVLSAGANAISVVDIEDAVELRKDGICAPIFLLAGVLPDAEVVKAIEQFNLIPTIYDEQSFQKYTALASRRMPVSVKIDVGAERIGVPASFASEFIERVAREPVLQLAMINAHTNLPFGSDPACLDWQYDQFMRIYERLSLRGVKVAYRTLASSKVLRLRGKTMSLNGIDPGDALFSALQAMPGLSPFSSLRSRLIQIRTVERDEFIESAPFPMRKGMRVGIIPIGYSDGMARLHCGRVLVNNHVVPLAGVPALEYTRINLDDVPDAKVGDAVTIIGAQQDACIPPEEVVRFQGAGRVADLAMQVGQRIARNYIS